MTLDAEAWRAAGGWIAFRSHRIFRVAFGAPSDPAILVLHGFPTSSHDFADVVPRLAGSGLRLVALDFLGFGFSDKPRGHPYSLFEQADLAAAVADEAGLDRFLVLAHDMGDSVALELLARPAFRPRIAGLALSNGSVVLEHFRPVLGQRLLRLPGIGPLFARLAGRRTFVRQLSRVFAPGRVPRPERLDELWRVASERRGTAHFARIIRYLDERRRHERGWLDTLARSGVPLLVLWGLEDPVATPRIADTLAALRPDARVVRLAGVGHYPQIEDPARFAREVVDFASGLLRSDQASARARTGE